MGNDVAIDTEKDIVAQYIKSVELQSDSSPAAKIRPTRISLNGRFLVMKSGKTIWRRVGDAKSALRHDLLYASYLFGTEYSDVRNEMFEIRNGHAFTYAEANEIAERAYQRLLSMVEFVDV